MSKLHRGIVEYAFGEYGFFHLPKLLNFHGVNLGTFRMMRLANKPALLRDVLVHRDPKLKQPLRNYLDRYPKADGVGLFCLATKGMSATATREYQDKLRNWADNLVKEFRLYQDGEVVKSEICGTFNWSTFDQYEAELEMWKTAECGECGHEETFRDDGMGDELADVLDDFEHVTGPYVRCGECDSVTRLTIDQADEMPYGTEYGDDEWEDYENHLQYLLEQLEEDIKAKGYPTPDGLYIGARNVAWRGRDGHKLIKFDGEELAKGVSVNSDFTISGGRLHLPQTGVGYLSCCMSHHDVPTGGSVTITPYWECELDGDPVVGDEISEHTHLAKAAEHLFAGPEAYHVYNPRSTFRAVSMEGFCDQRDWLVRQLDLAEDDPIRHFLERVDLNDRLIVRDAEAIRTLIDERFDREDAA